MKPNPQLDAIVNRAVRHLTRVSKQWPTFWAVHAQQRQLYRSERGQWPAWCFAPLQVTLRCLRPRETPRKGLGVPIVASAMAAWRATKGIYCFDPTMFDALWNTPIEGHLPVELLERLPEWCVYVPFPETKEYPPPPVEGDQKGERVCGVFACLDVFEDSTRWLHLCMERDDDSASPTSSVFDLMTASIRLEGTLSEAGEPFVKQVSEAAGPDPLLKALTATWARERERTLLAPIISILLWLCSARPEIDGLDPLRGLRTKKTRKGVRTFVPDQPKVYEVAYRIGAALRLAQAQVEHGQPGEGGHASPRPHIRRAHWHSFWTGPRAVPEKEQPTERRLILKWVAPIAVCAGGDDPVIPTVHPVKIT